MLRASFGMGGSYRIFDCREKYDCKMACRPRAAIDGDILAFDLGVGSDNNLGFGRTFGVGRGTSVAISVGRKGVPRTRNKVADVGQVDRQNSKEGLG